MSLRRSLPALALAVALLLALPGCAGGRSSQSALLYESAPRAEQSRIVTFFGYKADALNLTVIESSLHGFMDANPELTVTYEGLKGTTYWSAFDKRRDVGMLDDVFMVNHDRVVSMASAGELADLSALPTVEAFSPMAAGQFTDPGGAVWFLPLCISAYGLYVNYDLLAQHGQKTPETWAEFQAVCDYFVSQGIVPIIANNYSSLPSLMVAVGMYDVYQDPAQSAQIIRAFNAGERDMIAQLTPGVERVAEMVERGWFDGPEVAATAQTSDDLALFAQGERPFMITGGWATPRVKAMDPGFSYGVHPYPVLEDGAVLVIDVNTCVAVNAQSQQLSEATALVEYLTQPDVLWAYCDSQSSYSPLTEGRAPSDATIAPSNPYLTNGRSVIGSDYNLTLPLDAALAACANALLAGDGPSGGLTALRQGLTAN